MPKHLSPEQRLDILRAGDRFRKWRSLDDKRICRLCERIITGQQIEISRDQRGWYLLKCPTDGCPAIAAHWFYVTDDERLEALRASDDCRQSYSLDDQRLYIECVQLIDTRRSSSRVDRDLADGRLRCSTTGGDSTPRDWFYHGTGGSRIGPF